MDTLPLTGFKMETSGPNGTDKDFAIHFKELGNKDFKAGHFDKAIEHYSKAVGNYPLK